MKKTICTAAAIAAFSLGKYFMASLEAESQWWALPVLAIVTGIFTLVFFEIANKFRFGTSLLATGVYLLLTMTFLPLFKGYEFWIMVLTFIIVSIPSELIVNGKMHIGDVFLNPTIAALSAFVIQKINMPLLTPVILIIAYAMVIFINISFKRKENEKNEEEDDESVINNNKIDISI